MSKAGKTFIEYNCKNGVYSVDGTTVKPLTYLSSVTLDKSISTDNKYGDGEVVLALMTDSGFTGTLETTARDAEFEKDLGFVEEIAQGLADVQVLENKTVSIGFECYVTNDQGVTKTKKVWLMGVNVAPASDSLSQNTDGSNESTASYGLTVKGVNLKNTAGTDDYRDANGNTKKVYKVSSLPTDAGYDAFFNSVPTPSEKAPTPTPTTCTVTFSTTPEAATIVVKDSQSQTVVPTSAKVYSLAAGNYTYTATADGYTTIENASLTVSSSDVTTGTKTVNVTMEEA